MRTNYCSDGHAWPGRAWPLFLTCAGLRLPLCRYDPDEIEEEQRERERRNSINRQFSQFVKRVQQDIWERDYG